MLPGKGCHADNLLEIEVAGFKRQLITLVLLQLPTLIYTIDALFDVGENTTTITWIAISYYQ